MLKINDRVVVTNIDGVTKDGNYADILSFFTHGIGEEGKVVGFDAERDWEVEVEHDDGVRFFYNESELEVVE